MHRFPPLFQPSFGLQEFDQLGYDLFGAAFKHFSPLTQFGHEIIQTFHLGTGSSYRGNVDAHVGDLGDAEECVHVGAITVDEATAAMDELDETDIESLVHYYASYRSTN